MMCHLLQRSNQFQLPLDKRLRLPDTDGLPSGSLLLASANPMSQKEAEWENAERIGF